MQLWCKCVCACLVLIPVKCRKAFIFPFLRKQAHLIDAAVLLAPLPFFSAAVAFLGLLPMWPSPVRGLFPSSGCPHVFRLFGCEGGAFCWALTLWACRRKHALRGAMRIVGPLFSARCATRCQSPMARKKPLMCAMSLSQALSCGHTFPHSLPSASLLAAKAVPSAVSAGSRARLARPWAIAVRAPSLPFHLQTRSTSKPRSTTLLSAPAFSLQQVSSSCSPPSCFLCRASRKAVQTPSPVLVFPGPFPPSVSFQALSVAVCLRCSPRRRSPLRQPRHARNSAKALDARCQANVSAKVCMLVSLPGCNSMLCDTSDSVPALSASCMVAKTPPGTSLFGLLGGGPLFSACGTPSPFRWRRLPSSLSHSSAPHSFDGCFPTAFLFRDAELIAPFALFLSCSVPAPKPATVFFAPHFVPTALQWPPRGALQSERCDVALRACECLLCVSFVFLFVPPLGAPGHAVLSSVPTAAWALFPRVPLPLLASVGCPLPGACALPSARC
ncbi:hypothetical protein, conserved in T. vivax, partial [Trypanosoma vivax Y486]